MITLNVSHNIDLFPILNHFTCRHNHTSCQKVRIIEENISNKHFHNRQSNINKFWPTAVSFISSLCEKSFWIEIVGRKSQEHFNTLNLRNYTKFMQKTQYLIDHVICCCYVPKGPSNMSKNTVTSEVRLNWGELSNFSFLLFQIIYSLWTVTTKWSAFPGTVGWNSMIKSESTIFRMCAALCLY